MGERRKDEDRLGDGPPRSSRGRERLRAELTGLPRWKKVLLAGAGVFVLAGAGLGAFGADDVPRPADGPAHATPGTAPGATVPPRAGRLRDDRSAGDALEGVLGGDPSVPGGTTTTEPLPPQEAESPWTPFLLKGGFSFFVGFCVGFALRAFFKISALALGALGLVLFLLSYAGVVQVDWETLGGWFDGARGAVGAELASFRTFVAGSLPSAASAGLGLFSGFKR